MSTTSTTELLKDAQTEIAILRSALGSTKRMLNQALTDGGYFQAECDQLETYVLRLYVAIAFAFGAGFVGGLVMAGA